MLCNRRTLLSGSILGITLLGNGVASADPPPEAAKTMQDSSAGSKAPRNEPASLDSAPGGAHAQNGKAAVDNASGQPSPPSNAPGSRAIEKGAGDAVARPADKPALDTNGKAAEKLSEEEAKALLDEEEVRRRARRRNKGRLREIEEIRAELAEKELELLEKEKELLEKEQTVAVLREELEIEKRLRALLTKEKERAAEEAALAMGLCVGGALLP